MASTDLATLDEVKGQLQLGGTSKDAQVAGLITGASAFLENWCRKPLIQRDLVERHTGAAPGVQRAGRGRWKRIYLRARPIVSVTSVVDESPTPQSMVEGVDYYVFKDHGILEHYAWWPTPFKGSLIGEWVCTFKAGYFTGINTVPADVKVACAMQVAEFLARPAPSISSLNTGNFSASFRDPGDSLAPPAEVRAIMAKYKACGF
jgi:hypothetical protein